MKDELDRKIMVTFFGLKGKNYLLDDGSEGQKVKDRKKTYKNLNSKIMETIQKQLNLRIK